MEFHISLDYKQQDPNYDNSIHGYPYRVAADNKQEALDKLFYWLKINNVKLIKYRFVGASYWGYEVLKQDS